MKTIKHVYHISRNSNYNKKYWRQHCRENQNTFFMFNSIFRNGAVNEIMRKKIL